MKGGIRGVHAHSCIMSNQGKLAGNSKICIRIQSQPIRLCIKVGRGHRDACVGTWDLGTRDEGLRR